MTRRENIRARLERAIETAIDALDAFDGDTEAEAEPAEQGAEGETWFQPANLIKNVT